MAANENTNSEDNDTVLIKISNKLFSAEKSTLSSFSEYFRVMFSGNFVESKLRVVKINMVSPRHFKLFLDFINEGKLRWNEINSGNMARIFEAASMLQITKFIEACEEPLIKEWENFGHAGEMYELATTYGMNTLRQNLLRLLAKGVDLALESGSSEIYFGKGDTRVCNVNSDQISYEYLSECLREIKTPGEINFGTPVKKYFDKRDRHGTESALILEWVCKWLLKFLKDKEWRYNTEKIEKLLELSDLEFLKFDEIEKTLEVCNASSEIEVCNILSCLRECIYKQKARIQTNLKQIGFDFLLISPNLNRRDRVAKCLRCLPVLEDGQLTYHYENFEIPFDYIFLIPVVRGDDEEEYACLYQPGLRQCLTLNLATKITDTIRDIIPPLIVDSGIIAGGYLVLLGSHDRFWDCTEHDYAVLATVNMETSQLTREMIYDIREPNHFNNSNMVYMEGNFYFVACGPEREDAYKPFLYRYNPDRAELEISQQLYRYAKERTKRFHLAVHQRQLVIIGRDKLLVINTDCFIDGKPLKVFDVHRNGWKVWEAFSREGGLYLFCQKNVSYTRELCVADIYVFSLDLKNGILEGLGCLLDAFSNVSHKCPEFPPAPCNCYGALGLIMKLN